SAAIIKGAEHLLKQFDAKNWVAGVAEKVKEDEGYAGGLQALAVYALMQCGLALKGERPPADPAAAQRLRDLQTQLNLKGAPMWAKIEATMKFDLEKGRHQTYSYGLRSTLLALYLTNQTDLSGAKKLSGEQEAELRKRDFVKKFLANDAQWCVMATPDGSYTYPKHPKSPKTVKELLDYYAEIKKSGKLPVANGGFDNSNCQYGLLGAWSAAEAEIEIPTLYWYLVANHWTAKQLPNGQWPYSDGAERGGTPNMTAAGLASMLVTHEYIEPAIMNGSVGREPYNVPIKKGLSWFETGNNGVNFGGGYGMYGVERVGLASGFKFFGQHDWYRTLGMKIIKAQRPDGGWAGGGLGGGVVDTAYYLLFLSRGRHPILMNKLRFDGDAKSPGFWANRPRDAANLARIFFKRTEQTVNWQVINVATNWEEWLDSPILTLASHQPYNFSDADLDKLRNYVHAGGMLYVQADGGDPKMNKFADTLAAKLFRQDLVAVPPTHPLFTQESYLKMPLPLPQVKMVTNGARIFMLYSPVDMAKSWQARDDKGKGKPHFDLAVNMYYYGAGKGAPRNRLDTLFVAEPKTAPVATYPVARLSYPGPYWNAEPGAWKRFAAYFWRETGYKLVPTEVNVDTLKPFDPARKIGPDNIRVAHLTGTIEKDFTPVQQSAIKTFVESGGVLLIDVIGGGRKERPTDKMFNNSVEKLLAAAFPGAQPRTLPKAHPIYQASAPGMEELPRGGTLRATVIDHLGNDAGKLQAVNAGRGVVIYSQIDITSGLLGTNTSGVYGFEPQFAEKLMKNLVLWGLDGGTEANNAAAAAVPAAGPGVEK
ncbi:MAG TPA: DUF4159 domain-containing protein, partial [Humisphaera sp.]